MFMAERQHEDEVWPRRCKTSGKGCSAILLFPCPPRRAIRVGGDDPEEQVLGRLVDKLGFEALRRGNLRYCSHHESRAESRIQCIRGEWGVFGMVLDNGVGARTRAW